jgi:hypothetical protein
MNKFRNVIDEENQSPNAALLNVPGAATVKAFSMVVNSFLKHPLMPESISSLNSLTSESVDDLAFLHNSISVTGSATSGKQESTADNEAWPQVPEISKNKGMVHHLKNTHGSSHGAN